MCKKCVVRLCVALAMVTACGTEPVADISGQWDFSELIENASGSITCDGLGDLLLDLAGGSNRVTGQRALTTTCTGAPAGFEDTVGGVRSITNGELSGQELSFEANLCEYEGTLDEAATQLSGTVTCEFSVDGQLEAFSGTWTAFR